MAVTLEKKRTAQRQHLNISNYAYLILSADSLSFLGEVNMSGMINTIFLNFFQSAESSISASVERQRTMVSNFILQEKYIRTHPQDKDMEFYDNSGFLSDSENETLDLIMSGLSRYLFSKHSNYKKQHVLKVRLQNEVYDILYEKDHPYYVNLMYFKSPSDYLKAVIEEYARKTYLDRENIFLKDRMDFLRSELERSDSEKRILTITVNSVDDGIHKYNIKPFFITKKSLSEYHYLVCMASPAGSHNSEYVPSVFRISWITNIQIRAKSFGSGRITKAQQMLLEDYMREKGAAFINGTVRDFTILLTPVGYQKYSKIAHLKPLADFNRLERDDKGNYILHFHCTENQIKYFFFRFGSHAKILEPAETSERFLNDYKAAVDTYKS